ncbi:MAG: FtsX-like permease family protein, partial [bacterium]
MNNSTFLPKLVYKFLFRSRSIGVLPWLTLFALVSVAVGVATLILVLSVMNGFSTTLQEQLVGIHSPLRVYSADRGTLSISKTRKRLGEYVPESRMLGVYRGEVLLKGSGSNYQGGRILAFTRWRDGRLNVQQPPEDGILLGQGLARSLFVFPGSDLLLIRPNAQSTPFGVLPGGTKVSIKNTFKTGYKQLDQYLGIVSWKTARKLFDLPEDRASYIEVWIQNRYKAFELKKTLSNKFEDAYSFVTWKDSNPALFKALQLERTVTFIVLTLIVLVAAINILSMLVLSILQRRRQIAMMMAMGASPGRILMIFMMAGMLITVSGLVIGLTLGIGGAYLLDNVFIIQLPPVYPLTKLPVEVSLYHVSMIVGVTLL